MEESAIPVAAKRRRGRPPGQKMRVESEALRHTHFSFVRTVLDLGEASIRGAWDRYLSYEGGPDDERHFRARLRQLVKVIRAGASARGLGASADIAFSGLEHILSEREPKAQPGLKDGHSDLYPEGTLPSPASAIPSIDDWVTEKVEQGQDRDFYSQREWMELYQEEFQLNQEQPPVAATALPDSKAIEATRTDKPRSPAPVVEASKAEQIKALAILTTALAKDATLADMLGSWLTPELTKRFENTTVKGKKLPLLTVGNLIDFVNLHHNRWWVHVPRIGEDRAQRIIAWLVGVAEQLGKPLRDSVLLPKRRLELSAEAGLMNRRGGVQPTFGVVPLYRLAVPESLDGSDGRFRALGDNVLDASRDVEAITKWLERYQGSPRTFENYGAIVERFYLWCLWIRKLPMSSLTEGDVAAYASFMANPPFEWIQSRQTPRNSKDWRPFRKPLSPQSRHLNMTVISNMLKSLHASGYLRANAAAGVVPQVKHSLRKIQIDRSFDEAQWAFIMRFWRREYEGCGPTRGDGEEHRIIPDEAHPDINPRLAAGMRRTLLVLELGSTTSLRLIELVTTRHGSLTRELVDGQSVWLLKVLGKGNKEREVVVFDDVKALIDQHRADMELAGIGFDPNNDHLQVLRPAVVVDTGAHETTLSTGPGSPQVSAEAKNEPDPKLYPIVGALRKRPPPWSLGKNGVALLDRTLPGNADRYGALNPSALYQSLKRFLKGCANAARQEGVEIDADKLERASTHWLRHFFANSAVADGVALGVVRDIMGHASIATTSIYLQTERRAMVSEMTKVRRRSTGRDDTTGE